MRMACELQRAALDGRLADAFSVLAERLKSLSYDPWDDVGSPLVESLRRDLMVAAWCDAVTARADWRVKDRDDFLSETGMALQAALIPPFPLGASL